MKSIFFQKVYYTGQVNFPYSNNNDTVTKAIYNKNIVKPRPLFIFQWKQAMDMITNMSIKKSIAMEHTIPTLFTWTGVPLMIP